MASASLLRLLLLSFLSICKSVEANDSVDCDACYRQFKHDGGCEAMARGDGSHMAFVPAGCDSCDGAGAQAICGHSEQDSLGSSSSCGRMRDCNAPMPYSSLTLSNIDNTVYKASANFDLQLYAGAQAGVDKVRGFLGSVSPTRVYLFEAGGTSEAYDDMLADMCEFQGFSEWVDCGKREREAAMGGGGQYFLSGASKCMCSGNTYTGAPLIMMPSDRDTPSDIEERAVHEYTHAFQNAMGGPKPAWAMEGGAVYMECLMATRLSGRLFSDCMMYGGGGGGVIRNLRNLYLSTSAAAPNATDAGDVVWDDCIAVLCLDPGATPAMPINSGSQAECSGYQDSGHQCSWHPDDDDPNHGSCHSNPCGTAQGRACVKMITHSAYEGIDCGMHSSEQVTQPAGTTWLTTYGTDRCCGRHCPEGAHVEAPLQSMQERQVYYDVGAFAVAFAIRRASLHHGGRTGLDFWQSKSRGFWHAILPYDVDLYHGWPSSVPEGYGWKKALTDFTGDSTVEEFYGAFEAAVAPAGVVASEEELVAMLEADEDVQSMALVMVDPSAADYDKGPRIASCSGHDATPAPQDATRAPQEATPAPQDSTPAPTPAPQESTPAPQEATPAPQESTPAPQEATPAPTQAPVQPTTVISGKLALVVEDPAAIVDDTTTGGVKEKFLIGFRNYIIATADSAGISDACDCVMCELSDLRRLEVRLRRATGSLTVKYTIAIQDSMTNAAAIATGVMSNMEAAHRDISMQGKLTAALRASMGADTPQINSVAEVEAPARSRVGAPQTTSTSASNGLPDVLDAGGSFQNRAGWCALALVLLALGANGPST